jgi:MoxR-like ATPase
MCLPWRGLSSNRLISGKIMSTREDILALGKRMGESIIGQEAMIDRLLLGLLANGRILVEGLPGLAKTRAIKALAKNNNKVPKRKAAGVADVTVA